VTDALGSRPVGRLLWQACSQTTMSVGVYAIYALTNAWFVARGVGPDAMAAVNLVAPVLLVVGAVSTTVGVGGASLVSRALGAGDLAVAARAAGNAFALFWAVAALATVTGLVALGPLLRLLGARGDTFGTAHAYAAIIVAGALGSTGFTSLVRAEGRLRFSTLQWVSAIAVQMILDPVLIFGFHLGVRGAAIATVTGTSVSAAMSLWFFFVQRRRPYRIRAADLVFHGPTVRALAGVGAPSFLAGLGTTLLVVLVNNALAHSGGVVALAAYALSARIQTFVMMPQLGISQGLQPIVGYNAGRGLVPRVARALTLALRASLIYGSLMAAVVVLFAGSLAGFFLGSAPAARHALSIMALGFPVAGVAPLISAYCQAVGRATPSYLISIGSLLLVKAPLVLLLGLSGPTGVWIALAVGEVLSAALALLTFRRPWLGARR
jgi:putative MATE family efflux protein